MKNIRFLPATLFALLMIPCVSDAAVTVYHLPSTIQFPRGLTEGPDGSIYGTSLAGGDNGRGTVWKMTADGQFTVLVSFNTANGELPFTGLTLANGNFYGTTEYGGANGKGTVFKMTPAGALTTLVSFDEASLGAFPECRLLLGSDGYLYGSTESGYAAPPDAFGETFKMTLAGDLTPISTPGGAKGLVQHPDGFIYGVDDGSVFRLSANGNRTDLASYPWGLSAPILADDGKFYGTTLFGGTYDGGSVYKFTTAGAFSVVFSFDQSPGFGAVNATGALPQFGVVEGNDGNFYGTTALGGGHGYGNVFELTQSGELSQILSFTASNSATPLLLASDGNIYGASTDPGLTVGNSMVSHTTSAGSVFRIETGSLRPVSPGKYNGLFAETNGSGDTVVNVASAGMVKNLNVNKTGAFSGKLLLAGGQYNLTGTFGSTGQATVTVPTTGGSVVVAMTMDPAHGTISGTVSNSTGAWSSVLRANRGVKASSTRYTMLIPGADTNGVTSPPGAGFETINNANGNVSFSGAVADGTVASMTAVPIASNGDVPLYVSLYHGQGVLFGWINLSSTASGNLTWIANANAEALYPAGFTNRDIAITSSRWVKPIGTPPIPVTAGALTFSGVGITPLTYTVAGVVAPGNCLQAVTSNNTNTLHASIVAATGAMTLQVKNAIGKKAIIGRGALLQNTTNASGAFVINGKAGVWTLAP